MKVQVEKIEKNVVKIRMEVEVEKFLEGVQKAYFKNVKKYNVPGFRKGKVPKDIIERYYGEGVFFEEAVNTIFPEVYEEAVLKNNIFPVDGPELDVEQIGKDKDLILIAKVTVKPEVELGQYKGVEIKKVEYNVTDEDVEKEIKVVVEKNARIIPVEDRKTIDGDVVTISFEGFVDGVAVEGGSSENHTLVIGSGEFIPGFEEQLIGVGVNEEVDVNVVFPETYYKEDLAGKPAVFKVKVFEIKRKELPEIDDEFAKDVSEFDTLEEYKNDIRSKLEKEAQEKEKRERENLVLEKILENSTVEIPDVMIENQMERLAHDFEHNITSQGIGLEDYLRYAGLTMESFVEQFRERATKDVKVQLVLEKITGEESIEITDEEVREEIRNLAKIYNIEEEEFYLKFKDEDKEYIKNNLAIKKCIRILIDSAKVLN